jgi:hypothetical protein
MVSQKEEVSLFVAHREFTMPVATGNWQLATGNSTSRVLILFCFLMIFSSQLIINKRFLLR